MQCRHPALISYSGRETAEAALCATTLVIKKWFFFSYLNGISYRATLKVMPPIVLRWPMMSEGVVYVLAVEVEPCC